MSIGYDLGLCPDCLSAPDVIFHRDRVTTPKFTKAYFQGLDSVSMSCSTCGWETDQWATVAMCVNQWNEASYKNVRQETFEDLK